MRPCLLLSLPLLLLGACASSGAANGAADASRDAELDGTSWRIASVDGVPADGARVPTMDFADGRIGGNSGCNRYSGRYTRDGEAITIGAIISTKMACLGGGMEGERRLFDALEGRLILARPAQNALTLSGGDHVITLERID